MKVDALDVFKETVSLVFNVDGAVVLPELKITKGENSEEEIIELPDLNAEYKFALIRKDSSVIFASKDGQSFVIAAEVKLISGKVLSYQELYEILFE